MKRISFSKYNAEHLYHMLRFYWKDDYDKNWTPQEIKKCGKFGCCSQCETMGKRLEKFIGKKAVRYTDKLIKESGEKVSLKSPKF